MPVGYVYSSGQSLASLHSKADRIVLEIADARSRSPLAAEDFPESDVSHSKAVNACVSIWEIPHLGLLMVRGHQQD